MTEAIGLQPRHRAEQYASNMTGGNRGAEESSVRPPDDGRMAREVQAAHESQVNMKISPLEQEHIGGEDLKVAVPSNFYEKLFKEDMNLTHGYVHGHVHHHKDHMHIHGHIHNHEHADQAKSKSTVESQAGGELEFLPKENDMHCEDLHDLEICKDILCNELNDCFFLICDDTKKNTKEDGEKSCSECVEPYDYEHIPEGQKLSELNLSWVYNEDDHPFVCNDPSCLENSDSKDACCRHDDADLCYNQDGEPANSNMLRCTNKERPCLSDSMRSKKKRKTLGDQKSNFEIHFPQYCHPNPDLNEILDMNNEGPNHSHSYDKNVFRQSCFHTMVPNVSSNNEASARQKELSDFDFFVQFNNFKNYMDVSGNKTHQIDMNHDYSYPKNEFEKTSDGLSNGYIGIKDNVSDMSPSLYSCQWDKCSKKVSLSNFLQHIIDSHIEQEYADEAKRHTNNSNQSFQCEWNDCNYMNNDINSLIDHMNTHIPSENFLKNENIQILTPNSTVKSNDSSPLTPSLGYEQLVKNVMDGESSTNITNPMSSKASMDDTVNQEYVCCWQVDVDLKGNPVPCNKVHKSTGDLHNHIVNDHIGLGKSKYTCDWIGCERHNGKCFPQRQKLKRHIHIHTNYKPCKCDICGACFAVDTMLQQHLRTHSGEKPFCCTICGKRFATGSSLSIHNRVHTGEKPLVCKWPGCGKRFSESSNMTKHMRVHLKAFKCHVCEALFDKKTDLSKHMKAHSALEQFNASHHAPVDKPHPSNLFSNLSIT